jgi:hypothetical protein
MKHLLLGMLLLQAGPEPGPAAADTAAILREARRAERTFERLARERVPMTHLSFTGRCDEVVGRFCLSFAASAGALPAPVPEADVVIHARREAVEALRAAFSLAPHQFEVTGPLVRYLVEDDRAAEAASAARAYLALSRDTLWGSLLLGFAQHAAGHDTAAARLFSDGLARMEPAHRERVEDLRWLLSWDEQRHYRRLDPAARQAYAEAFWRLADPLYLTPGNERQAQHIARHVWSRMLERAPRVAGMFRWAEDLEQLTVRYGIPVGRFRSMGRTVFDDPSLVERYDPEMLAYAPDALHTRGVPPTPLPRESWPLEQPRARSGYAPHTIRRIVPLDHQLSRFPAADGVLVRLDGVLALDSAAAAAGGAVEVETGLFVLDSTYAMIAERRASVSAAGDSVHLSWRLRLPPGEHVYSLEALEPETRLAGRARYAVTLERPAGLALSDAVVARPFGDAARPASSADPALHPLPGLVLDPDARIGIYAEVHGLAPDDGGVVRYRVELARRQADERTIPAQVVRWLGRRLGLAGDGVEPTVSWSAEGRPGVAVIALDVDMGGASAGLHAFELTVTDVVAGAGVSTTRIVLVEAGGYGR